MKTLFTLLLIICVNYKCFSQNFIFDYDESLIFTEIIKKVNLIYATDTINDLKKINYIYDEVGKFQITSSCLKNKKCKIKVSDYQTKIKLFKSDFNYKNGHFVIKKSNLHIKGTYSFLLNKIKYCKLTTSEISIEIAFDVEVNKYKLISIKHSKDSDSKTVAKNYYNSHDILKSIIENNVSRFIVRWN
ncbi:MAG: hypothetical protein CVT95_07250 [Bacteroidetes bacterium HGW-Bacteroidetes-12]|nr:MAG: hypothetical protein CVT95_07250 [Bacteroidetes bacterium HGW-Bacteroidetes-12]